MEKDFLKALKNFVPLIQKAKEDKMNEQDTRNRLFIMLEKVFGYDPLEDISAEFNVKGTHVDFAIKVKGEVKFLIEAKRADEILKDRHVMQAANYAANQGIPFALLTNLSEFWIYRIEFGGPVDYIPIFKTDILEKEDITSSSELLWLLTKRAFKNDELNRYSKTMDSLSDENLLSALVSEDVLNAIRRELRKISEELVPRELVEKAIIARFPEEVINMIKESSSVRRARKRKPKEEKEQTAGASVQQNEKSPQEKAWDTRRQDILPGEKKPAEGQTPPPPAPTDKPKIEPGAQG
jgi:hypothetical protein